MNFEFPLVFFTIFSQLAVGITIFAAWSMFRGGALAGRDEGILLPWLCAFVASVVAIVASLFHLGHPFSAYRALSNLGESWLSREVLLFGIFCVLALINVFRRYKGVVLLTAIIGVFGVFAQGFTYAAPAIPAIDNAFPLALFLLSALVLGSFHEMAATDDNLFRIGRISTAMVITVLLLAPAIWLSGTATMRESAVLWFSSPVFWIGIILLILGFCMSFCARVSAKLRLVSLLVGLFLTRMTFFADTVHTAKNMGLPFN